MSGILHPLLHKTKYLCKKNMTPPPLTSVLIFIFSVAATNTYSQSDSINKNDIRNNIIEITEDYADSGEFSSEDIEELTELLEDYILSFTGNGSASKTNNRTTWGLKSGARMILPFTNGYDKSRNVHFAGGPIQYRNQYSIKSQGKYSAGISFEKDAGEPEPPNYDYISGYISIDNIPGTQSFLKNITLGDFKVNSGYGLVMGQNNRFLKPGFTMSTLQKGRGVIPNRGFDETGYNRGLAITTEINKWGSFIYYANQKRSAVLRESSDYPEQLCISSFPSDGLHRTETEIARKNNITQQSAGVNIQYGDNRVEWGLKLAYREYSLPVVPDITGLKNYNISGYSGYNAGTDLRIKVGSVIFTSEIAVNETYKLAYITGLQSNPLNGMNCLLIYRNYSPLFFSSSGSAFGAGNRNNNEEGLFLQISYSLSKQLKITSFCDTYRSVWVKYRIDMPSSEKYYGIRTEYSPRNNALYRIDFRLKQKEEEINSDNRHINVLYSRLYSNNKRIRLRTGYSDVETKDSYSKSYSAGLSYMAGGNNNKIKREYYISRFSADQGMSTIWIVQRAAFYTTESVAATGDGIHAGIWTEYTPHKRIAVSLKAGSWIYDNKRQAGSGVNDWQGKFRHSIELAVKLK